MMNSNQIKEHFNKISDGPCWNVEKGIGSFLTFEFGKPQIEFTEPKIWGNLKYPLNQSEARRVFLKGTERLWIYCVDWTIFLKGVEIAHNESEDKQIDIGTKMLNGQILQKIEINSKIGETKFVFDLGGELLTYNKTHDKTDESWTMYVDENVLTMNNIGQFNLSKSNRITEESEFEKIEGRIEVTLHNNRS